MSMWRPMGKVAVCVPPPAHQSEHGLVLPLRHLMGGLGWCQGPGGGGRAAVWWESVDSALDSGADKKLFEVKRKDQMNALKNLIELNDVNQQYKIIDIMLKGLFKVLEDSRAVLIAADVPPDGPFPQDEKIKDAYSHVVENTAFFGDVVLRFPKIVHHYFDRNSNWNSLIRWGIGFCNLTGVFEQGPHSQVLRLMAQELGISEKSPDYRNPFKTDQSEFFPSADTFQKALRDEEKRRKKEEKRKEIRKGPRISRSQSEL
ncbi:coiled-coil domain-containing protein 134 isoform X1 [Pyrgilauda ruficollis]|uniref:coiled-coil domain-containing protein 134 isoform X1 n=1 Tax=Pyrgilauda ruficollis TaxID=221976 RepID=UPI001B8733CC|nr:coiled-coil domain-containing protein 134 isoform X1 [Pyrgilauda ruficollis]